MKATTAFDAEPAISPTEVAERTLSWSWTTLADDGLPHNHHKPQLAGYELGGSQ
jgi:hypothetical protein